MRFLFLTTVLPRGGGGGGEIVSQGVIDVLRQSAGEVRVLGYRRPEDRSPLLPGEVCVGRRPVETSSAGMMSLVWMARAAAAGVPYSSMKYRSRGFRRAVREALGRQPGIVFVDHAQVHFGLDLVATSLPVVFIAHNVEGDSYRRLAGSAEHPALRWAHRREAGLIGNVESDMARRAAQIWTLTDEDADCFRALGSADVRTLEVASAFGVPDGVAPTHDIGLIGTWSWEANALGLRWFSAEVVPRLPDHLRIEVAGRGAEWLRGRHANLTVRGPVPDAQRFLSQARVVAVPAVAGGGVQIKTLDAIASGSAAVATPVAARGLGRLPRSVFIAKDPVDFAAHLGRLAADPAQRPDPEAVSWSRARRARFQASLEAWTGELVRARTKPELAPSGGTETSN